MAGASDFSCFYAAGKMVDSGDGSRIYDRAAQCDAQRPFYGRVDTHKLPLPFVFVPFILAIFAPLALLAYSYSLTLWYAVNACLLISVPFLLRRRLRMTDKQLSPAILASSLFLPSSISLGQGQPTILALVLFTLVFLDLGNGQATRAGCLLALTTFKPQFALPLLLALMLTRNWKAVAGFVSTCIALLGVSAAIAGWRTTLSFPRAVAEFSAASGKMDGEHVLSMPNLRGFLYFLLDPRLSRNELDLIAMAASALVVLIVLWLVFSNCRHISDLQFALIIVVTLLVSFHSYGHDLILLLLPFFLVASYIGRHELTYRRMAIAMVAGVLLILPSMLLPPQITVIVAALFLVALITEILHPNAFDATHGFPELKPSLK
ncbi:MAG: glycosyltransferase family 87 protein [Candidatus Korobacteraceae bacterium]